MKVVKRIKNIALAVLFAAAVMFVMPAAVFADDTLNNEFGVDHDGGINTELTVTETNDTIENTGLSEESAVTEDTTVCYGVCCDACDETCNGTCCDMCIIFKDAEGAVPDNFEDISGDVFTTDDNLNDNRLTEDGNFDNNYSDGLTAPDRPANDFENSYENGNILPPISKEPVFPNIDVIVPENPDDIYQLELGDDLTDNNEDFDEKIDNEDDESEEIIYDDLTEEEIIFGDDESDDEKSDGSETQSPDIDEENTGDSDESSDNTKDEEDLDNPDNELSDNITDEENPDNIDNELSDNTEDEEDPDYDESSDNTNDEEKSDGSDNEVSDNAADDEDNIGVEEDNSDSEAMEEDENPVINVVLPVSISVMVNPYNLQTANDNDFHYSILSPEYTITNYSNCDVLISATVSASTEGGVVLSPYDLNGDETEFTAFIYLETTDESNKYSDKYSNNANQLAFSNDIVSKEILTLADGSNGETVGYFRINGQAVLPDNAEYSSQAMLNMVITFDIAPVSKAVVPDNVDNAVENTENAENIENVESVNNVENV